MAYDDFSLAAQKAAEGFGVPWEIFRGLIQQESRWNANAVSPKGAYGLTQLMPGTAAELGVNPYSAAQNLVGGAKYLRQMFDRYGNWNDALGAYNAGPGRWDKVLAGKSNAPAETVDYVDKVMGNAASYGYTGQTTGGAHVWVNGQDKGWFGFGDKTLEAAPSSGGKFSTNPADWLARMVPGAGGALTGNAPVLEPGSDPNSTQPAPGGLQGGVDLPGFLAEYGALLLALLLAGAFIWFGAQRTLKGSANG